MKIGVISDIHCNLPGLLGALEAMADCDEVFCAGDAIFGYRFSNEVIDLLRTRGVQMVMGNHDRDFMRVWYDRGGSNGAISPENLTFIEQTPYLRQVEIGGKRVLMAHGTPIAPHWDYIYANGHRFHEFGQLNADILLVGHTHVSYIERVGKVLVCNPGSAGMSRDPAKPYVTYATIDLQSEEAIIHGIPEPDLSKPSFNRYDREALTKLPTRWSTDEVVPAQAVLVQRDGRTDRR